MAQTQMLDLLTREGVLLSVSVRYWRAAKKLQALGYLTGTARDDGGARPDPKEAIGSLTTLQTATRLHEAGRSAEALPLLLEVLEANPRLVDGWEVLASAYERLGRMDEALAALKKTVALSPPGRSNYVADVAALALRAGRLEEARSHREAIEEFLRDELHMELSKASITRTSRGVNFCGYRTWASKRFVRRRALYNFRRAARRGAPRARSAGTRSP